MPNLLDLAKRLEAKAKQIEEKANQTAIKTALAIVEDLAFNTPVDTSQALSNWLVTIGTPASGTIGPHVPGTFGNTQFASANATIAQAVAILTNKKPGQPIYITNNLDYILDLDAGTISRQPGAFVARALVIGRIEAAKFKL